MLVGLHPIVEWRFVASRSVGLENTDVSQDRHLNFHSFFDDYLSDVA